MTLPVRFEVEAEEELQEAAAWYERERRGFGMALLERVAETVERIRESPEGFSRAPGVPPDLHVRRALVQRFPYAVVFVGLEDEIRILAIAHGRRRPGYWRERLAG